MKDVLLALGGGGVKGHAHLGVIRLLEREGYRVRGIAGTSAGGLWGGLYAFGYPPDAIEHRIHRSEFNVLFHRQPGDHPAWLGISGLRALLEDSLGDCQFEDLRMPFAVTAVDLDAARHIIIRSGRLVDGILATIAVPGVFPYATRDGRILIDGGILDPVPVGLARSLVPGLPVVAVVLSPPMTDWSDKNRPRLLTSLSFLARYMERFRFSQALNLFMRSIDISGALLTELLLAIDPPEVIIRPEVRGIGLLDNVEPETIARLGEQAAEKVLPELARVVTWKSRLKRRLQRRFQKPFPLPYATDVF